MLWGLSESFRKAHFYLTKGVFVMKNRIEIYNRLTGEIVNVKEDAHFARKKTYVCLDGSIVSMSNNDLYSDANETYGSRVVDSEGNIIATLT